MLFAVAQRELELAGEQEVSMQWVVAIDADPTVDVDGRVHNSVAADRSPIGGDRDLIVGGLAGVETPRCLPGGEGDRLGVDVGVTGPIRHGLEGRNGAIELLALLRVLGGELDRGASCARHEHAHADRGPLFDPPDDRGSVFVSRGRHTHRRRLSAWRRTARLFERLRSSYNDI